MTRKQEEKVIMQKAVMEVMEKHLTKWQSVTELKKRYDTFVRNLKKIEDHSEVLKKDLTSLKTRKDGARKELIERIFPIINVLGVYAFDTGDPKLGKLVRIKFSELEKMNPSGLMKYGKRIHAFTKNALEVKKGEGKKRPKHSLPDYGLTVKHLEDLKGALDAYGVHEKEYLEMTRSKKDSRVKLVKRIKENNALLKKRLDKLMHLFHDHQKELYSDYINARKQGSRNGPGKKAAVKKALPKKAPPKKAPPKKEEGAKTNAVKSTASSKPAVKRKSSQPSNPAAGKKGNSSPVSPKTSSGS